MLWIVAGSLPSIVRNTVNCSKQCCDPYPILELAAALGYVARSPPQQTKFHPSRRNELSPWRDAFDKTPYLDFLSNECSPDAADWFLMPPVTLVLIVQALVLPPPSDFFVVRLLDHFADHLLFIEQNGKFISYANWESDHPIAIFTYLLRVPIQPFQLRTLKKL